MVGRGIGLGIVQGRIGRVTFGRTLTVAFAFLLSFSITHSAFAQKVDIKDVDTTGQEPTTISISKGDKAQKTQAIWEVVEGAADIAGEPQMMSKQARASWKTACDDWKKEIRADNKDNKILSLNCGTPNCAAKADSTVCESKASYKLKTRLD